MQKIFLFSILAMFCFFTACNGYEEPENKESILYALKSRFGKINNNTVINEKNSTKINEKKADTQALFVNQTDNQKSYDYGRRLQNTGEIQLIHIPTRNGGITEIYDGALTNIRMIKEAQRIYLLEHGSYTYDLSALNLAFEDVSQQYLVGNTQRIYLNNGYYYVLTDKLVAVYENNTMYHLDFYYDGQIKCISKMRSMDNICEELGGINPEPNKRISSWISYSLPESFL